MITKALTPQIKTSYLVAILAYYFAFLIGAKVNGPAGASIVALFVLASIWLVISATFQWGKLVGYPVYNAVTGFSLEHFLRNLVMTGLVFVMLALIGSPILSIAVWLSAKK
jgi:hypothetical protein